MISDRPMILEVVLNRGEPSFRAFTEKDISIGSSPDNRLILESEDIAPHHARIRSFGTYMLLEHLGGNSFRTYVDGQQVFGQSVIHEGQRVELRPFSIAVHDRFPPGEVEQRFLDAIQARPREDEAKVVYGDWLEEQGREDESEFLRAQLEIKKLTPDTPRFHELGKRLSELAPKMSLPWRRTVAAAPLENCKVISFEIACPKRWDALLPTLSPKERYCDACQKNVHYAPSVFEAQQLALQGHCVAVDIAQPRSPGDLKPRLPPLPGMIAPPDLPPPPPLSSIGDDGLPKK